MAKSIEVQAMEQATGGMTRVAGETEFTFHPPLRCVVVTPERAVLDEPAEFVVLPMIDGELGVLPRHAPLVGRMGKGQLRITQPGGTKKILLVQGGFAQVRNNAVTVLTERVETPTPPADPYAALQGQPS